METHQQALTREQIAANQVDALLARYPLLNSPSETRTFDEVRQDMIRSRLPSVVHGALPVAVSFEQPMQTEV